MFRDLILKSIRYSFYCIGTHYAIAFSIMLYIYLYLYRNTIVLIITLTLSILMVIASILADRRNIVQFINVLNLVGIRRRILLVITIVFIYIRSLFIIIAYSIGALYNSIMVFLALFTHLTLTLILSLIIKSGVL